MSAVQIKDVRWWHEAIVDWELANPEKTLNECAGYFNVSVTWLSIVRNSDAFRAYQMRRREEFNKEINKTLVQKLEHLAGTTVEVLQQRIERERDNIKVTDVAEVAGMALKAMGFGPSAGNRGRDITSQPTNVTINIVSPDLLERARER